MHLTLPAMENRLEPARSVPMFPTSITSSCPLGTLDACAVHDPSIPRGNRPVQPPLQARKAKEREAWLAAKAAAHLPNRQSRGSELPGGLGHRTGSVLSAAVTAR